MRTIRAVWVFYRPYNKHIFVLIRWKFCCHCLIRFADTDCPVWFFPVSILPSADNFNVSMNFTSFYTIIMAGLLIAILFLRKETIKKDMNMYLIVILGVTAFLSTTFNGIHIGFGNPEFTHYIEAVLLFFVITIFVSTKKKLRLFSWLLLFAIAALVFRLYNHSYTYDCAIFGFENNYLARILSFYIPFLIGFFWAEKKKYLKFLEA